MTSKTAEIEGLFEVSAMALIAITPMLHSYALRRLRSRSNADDAVQDTLERAWSACHTFRRGAALKPWIFRILRNTIIDRHRQGKYLIQDVGALEVGRLETKPDQFWRLRYAEVVAALEILSPDQRRALLLVVYGATTVEAAAVMKCPLGTLKSHLRLARQKLKDAGV